MEKNTEFHTYKPRQDRSFRVVIRNLHPSTDIQDIKQAIMEKGHEVKYLERQTARYEQTIAIALYRYETSPYQ